ncbi:MAG: hypothetical protein FWG50_09545 [Kiritimatiellaeota bacterium]|nr:hypothetical protein [Kiritimatiellota bacterium]
MRSIRVTFACVALCAGAAGAQTAPKIDEELNELMASRAKAMVEAHQLQQEISRTWADPAYTSPEIVVLRKKLQALEDAVAYAQDEIKGKVEALPQVQEKKRKLQEAMRKAEDLNKKIEARQGNR